ncbi:MAG: dihydropteroate synthase [Phycisphaerales bacterium]
MAHGRAVSLEGPCVVAILNTTPDSFYDGGTLQDVDAAVLRARQAARDGAAMLDVGGESTRPGAERVSANVQIDRVVPVIDAIRRCEVERVANLPISVDTTLGEVAQAAIDAGADAINDVSGGAEDPTLLDVAARNRAGLVLMHRGPAPPEDRYADEYEHEPVYPDGVVNAVREALSACARRAVEAGIATNSIVIDPGLGFGKSVEQNLELVRRLDELTTLGFPVYVGASRKRFVGRVSIGPDSKPADRLAGSLAITVLAAQRGGLLHRVHDVAEHVQALSVLGAWNAGGQHGV